MNFKAAAATILHGKLLIDPLYAITQLPLVVRMINEQVSDFSALKNARLSQAPDMVSSLPRKRAMAAAPNMDVYSVSPYTSTDRLPFASIVMIDIIGPILKYGSWYGWGSVELSDLIIRMANSDKVKGIIINIDSPGGQAAGTADLAQTIRLVTRLKPVLGIVQDGIAASAGAWIFSAPQEGYLTQPTDQVGSIGAYQTIIDLTKFYEEMGIVVRDIYAPQSVDKNQDYIKALEGDDTLVKEDLKFLVDHFISAVKSNRGQRIKTQDKEPFTGKMYNAADAISFGLADGIKSLPEVVKRMEQLITLRA